MSHAWEWAKRHEHRLWWAFLVASIAVAQIRNPSCSPASTPWWGWALPIVIFLGMWLWMMWVFRRHGSG